MKEYIKNNIIILSIIVLIIFIILISIMIVIYKKNNLNDDVSEEEIDSNSFDVKIEDDISKVIENNEFYNVKNCVQYYIDYLNDENYDAVYKVLDKNFIINNNITIEKLESSNIKLDGNIYIANKINKKEEDLDLTVYFVYGHVVNDDYTSEKEKNFTVIMDKTNELFAIIPENLEGSSYEYNFDIEDDTTDYYNEFIYKVFSEEEILTEYFNYYKSLALSRPNEAFLLLKEEYRDKRFGNDESKYIEYLKNINIDNIYPTKYMYNVYDDYAEYVCIDKNGIYYIFQETAPMEFKLMLDTYTIESEKFITEYDNADDDKKVMMNVDKWIMMLENKDYENAYNILDETFRDNNFENLEEFEEYIKNNISNNYSLNFKEQTYVGEGIYTEKIELTNDEENIVKTIIIKLQDNRKFVLSFDK